MMDRVNKICSHPLWIECLEQIRKKEENRDFCKHDMAHFLDVARIAYIESLEKKLDLSKECIYAAALLHDIGRAAQYQSGIPHEQASADLAKKILPDCGFDDVSQSLILRAVDSHRNAKTAVSDNMEGIIYRADKKSRNCMFCPAAGKCSWSDEKKNLNLFV